MQAKIYYDEMNPLHHAIGFLFANKRLGLSLKEDPFELGGQSDRQKIRDPQTKLNPRRGLTLLFEKGGLIQTRASEGLNLFFQSFNRFLVLSNGFL